MPYEVGLAIVGALFALLVILIVARVARARRRCPPPRLSPPAPPSAQQPVALPSPTAADEGPPAFAPLELRAASPEPLSPEPWGTWPEDACFESRPATPEPEAGHVEVPFDVNFNPLSASPETRPASPETRPASPETRPASPETRPASPETRPASPETRPASPETRPASPELRAIPRTQVPIGDLWEEEALNAALGRLRTSDSPGAELEGTFARLATAQTPAAAVALFVERAGREHTDDQNVHDSGVLACESAILARLRDDQGAVSSLPPLDEIAATIDREAESLSEGNPASAKDAAAVVARAAAGDYVCALGATDEECIRRVWARADDPRNAGSRLQLRQAFVVHLSACWELSPATGLREIVCPNGRASQVLASLALLDWDERNWAILKTEQFRSDVYALAQQTINSVAARAAASSDPELRAAGKAYGAMTAAELRAIGPVPDYVAERLADEIRTEVDIAIVKYAAQLEAKQGIGCVFKMSMLRVLREMAGAGVS